MVCSIRVIRAFGIDDISFIFISHNLTFCVIKLIIFSISLSICLFSDSYTLVFNLS